jgi:hypothetical protein
MPKYYDSPDQIRETLGLKPWDEFKKKIKDDTSNLGISSIPREFIDKNRRTGRTTKMLVDAVYEAQSKIVAISAYNEKYEKSLVSQARLMCDRVGITRDNIHSYQEAKRNNVREFSLFSDHYSGMPQGDIPIQSSILHRIA